VLLRIFSRLLVPRAPLLPVSSVVFGGRLRADMRVVPGELRRVNAVFPRVREVRFFFLKQ
jgi:hypothetical protein